MVNNDTILRLKKKVLIRAPSVYLLFIFVLNRFTQDWAQLCIFGVTYFFMSFVLNQLFAVQVLVT